MQIENERKGAIVRLIPRIPIDDDFKNQRKFQSEI